MKQCFGYVRVSSLKQGEGVSLDAQKDAIQRFAEANDITIIKWFEEQQTAAKSGRPVFNQMLKALKSKKAAGVVMHKIDRSARNFFDWAKIGELADNGIDVHFATESLDFQSRGGRLTANIQMAVAEDYVRNLRAEVFKGQRGQMERGFYPFSAPLGYLNNGKRQLKTIDATLGPLIKRAFELYGSGQYSYDTLRHELANHGFTQASGAPRSRGCLEAVLANPFYAGVIRIKRSGEVFQGAHEPLIPVELFERVQAIKAGKSGKKVTRHNHLFRGLFDCGQCGRSMIPERQKGNVYYRCHFADCAKNSVREEPLEKKVIEVLQLVRIPEDFDVIVDQAFKRWQQTIGDTSTKQNSLAMRLVQIEERIEKLEDAVIEQIIDKTSFERRKEKLLLEKTAITRVMRKVVRFHQSPEVIRRFLELVKSLADHYISAEPPQKREIVEIALSNRRVTAKYVSAEPSDWLERTERAVANLTCAVTCAHSRTSDGTDGDTTTDASARQCTPCAVTCAHSRTSDGTAAIKELTELARSPATARLYTLFMAGYKKAAFGQRGDQSSQAAA
ncbi:recombinase family protein [Roseibium sp. M-1]